MRAFDFDKLFIIARPCKSMRKPLKLAAYSFLILLIMGFLAGFFMGGAFGFLPVTSFSGLLVPLSVFYYVISLVLSLVAVYGFIIIGRKFKNKALVNVSWIGMALVFIYTFYILFGGFFINVPEIPTQEYIANVTNQSDTDTQPLYDFLTFVLIVHLVYSVIFGIFSIFWGVALLKIKDKIKYAKSSGILNIVTGATMFFFIGYFVFIATAIMELLLLFEASNRFEKKHKRL